MREILSSLDRSYTHAIQGHGINITPREKTHFRSNVIPRRSFYRAVSQTLGGL